MKINTIVVLMLSAVTTAVMSVASLNANAAGWNTCNGNNITWDNTVENLSAGKKSFPPGSAMAAALQTAVDRLNANPSKFYFTLSLSDTTINLNNGENEVWFSKDPAVLSGAPAITLTWSHCYEFAGLHYGIDETDVIFDVNQNYTTSMNKANLNSFGGSSRPFQTTAIHELGHAMGLNHENRWYNIMGDDWNHIHVNGSTARSYLGEDASEGSIILYGATSANIEDLSLSNFKYLGTSGQYSTHQPTQLFDSANSVLSSYNDSGERRYYVNKGQAVKLELTGENNGKATHTVKIAYYVSTNSTISTSDKLIGTGTVTLKRNQPATFKTSLVIPSDLIAGTNYWLGAIVDYDDALVETVSSNNATYLPIRVN